MLPLLSMVSPFAIASIIIDLSLLYLTIVGKCPGPEVGTD